MSQGHHGGHVGLLPLSAHVRDEGDHRRLGHLGNRIGKNVQSSSQSNLRRAKRRDWWNGGESSEGVSVLADSDPGDAVRGLSLQDPGREQCHRDVETGPDVRASSSDTQILAGDTRSFRPNQPLG